MKKVVMELMVVKVMMMGDSDDGKCNGDGDA